MSDATTGVAHANARVSTIPKLSPPSDGRDEQPCRLQLGGELVLAEPPRGCRCPSREKPCRRASQRTERGSAPTRRSRAPVRLWISGQARSSTGSPLRGSLRPMKTTFARGRPGRRSAVRTPLGITSNGRRCAAPRRGGPPPRRRCAGRSGSPRAPHSTPADRIPTEAVTRRVAGGDDRAGRRRERERREDRRRARARARRRTAPAPRSAACASSTAG